ncbi:MAG: hypothetical protein FLDDKLPJ_02656 [Phycisphaerae bacterium]|nr:hypothetical protein [Phycisphaerae bacterium]
MKRWATAGIIGLCVLNGLLPRARAWVGDAFTYQGRLTEAGAPFNGMVNLEFSLWDAAIDGAQIGASLSLSDVPVNQGLFTVEVNAGGEFGPSAFRGERRWLAISVNGTPLTPRQEVTPAPYAQFAASAPRDYALAAADGDPIDAVVVDNDGNVGIGTATPSALLHVAGPIRIDGDATLEFGGGFAKEVNAGKIGYEAFTPGALDIIGAGLDAEVRRIQFWADGGSTFTGPVSVGTGLQEGLLTIGDSSYFDTYVTALTSGGFLGRAGIQLRHGNMNNGWTLEGDDRNREFNLRYHENDADGTIVASFDRFGNLGVGRRAPEAKLHLAGNAKIDGTNTLEFGAGLSKETNAGKVGYQVFTPDALDIVGAGASGLNRKIKLWSEGGLTIDGPTVANGDLQVSGDSEFLGFLGVAGGAVFDLPVGIGTDSPTEWLTIGHFDGHDTYAAIRTRGGNLSRAGFKLRHFSSSYGWTIESDERNPANGLNILRHNNNVAGQSALFIATNNGYVGIGTTSPSRELDVDGWVRCDVLQITGGADLAEPFDVKDVDEIKPGMVVCIDPQEVGKMRLGRTAYDRTVAGVISGANGVRPGLMLQQSDQSATVGEHPVALTGRVWVYADADAGGPITAGDLLTTSNTPGHAMRVSDHTRAPGATLGKAMSALSSGRGMVLVLVALQ